MKSHNAKRIVVTSALPYANGSIHVGHLVEYIQTDIFVRFLKLIGRDAIYCCADDTHGTPIEVSAKNQGITPEKLIAKYHKEHQEDFKKFHIKFDSYYSTNSKENKKYAEEFFKKAQDKGLIYTKDVENFYDKKLKRFLPDRYVKGECPKCGEKVQYGDVCEKCSATYQPTELVNPYSTLSGEEPIRKTSKHYFFKLSAMSKELEEWLTNNKKLQEEIKNYVLNWIKEGLEDWDISRDGPYFGFKIPGEEDKYFYVWLDAPIGYISSTENYCNQHGKKTEDYWQSDEGQIIHVIGKDIIYFHFLFWPALLMAADYNLPEYLVVHGFLTVNGEKMSKSRGTFFTAAEFADKYDPQHLRYFYSGLLSKKMSDIDLDFGEFRDRINNELVANLGNFCYRTTSFLKKNFDGEFKSVDKEVIDKIKDKYEAIHDAYYNFNFKEALRIIMEISAYGNKYLQDNAPWKLVKDDKGKAQLVLGTCVNLAKNLGILISPILPQFSEELFKQLNIKDQTWDNLNDVIEIHKINESKILIQKMEVEEEKILAVDLRVAKIIEAKDHPDGERLLIFQLDIGGEKRQIVSSLKPYGYTKENMLNKKIIIVANLKPAKFRGEKSEGMLLCAEKGDKIIVIEPKKSEPGNQVSFEGYKVNKEQIKIDDFGKLKLEVKDKKVMFNDLPLKTDKEEIEIDIEDGAKVT